MYHEGRNYEPPEYMTWCETYQSSTTRVVVGSVLSYTAFVRVMSVCPVMNGSAVEGPERLDGEIGGYGSRYGTCAKACVCWHQSFKNSGSKFTRVGGRQ